MATRLFSQRIRHHYGAVFDTHATKSLEEEKLQWRGVVESTITTVSTRRGNALI
jgi:poly(A) polymerase Pap1